MDQTGKLVSSSLPAPASQSESSSTEPPARPAFQPDSSSSTEAPARPAFQPDSIAEEDEDDEKEKTTENPPAVAAGGSGGPCRWAVDLAGTEPYWRGWFEHLSAAFLDVATAKLLLLAGVDRLDRDLTVGQMQVFFSTNIFLLDAVRGNVVFVSYLPTESSIPLDGQLVGGLAGLHIWTNCI
jgi:hypothetical protein